MATIVPATIKFSEFAEQTAAQDDIFVGLKSGANAQFTYAAAPSDATYILQTADSDLTNAQAIGDLANGFLVGTTSTGVILSRVLTGTSREINITNGGGVGANPVFRIADNPVIPGTSGISIPSGTTGQRVVPSSPNINLRWNTTINAVEYYDHGSTAWEQLAESLPDGPSTSVQYNNGGAFAGSANFTFNGTDVQILGKFRTGTATTQMPFTGILSASAVIEGGNNLTPLIVKTNATASGYAMLVHNSVPSPLNDTVRIQGVGASNTTALLNCLNNANDTTGAATSIFYVRADGKVGIGTDAPDTTLHIVGDEQIIGNLRAGTATTQKPFTNVLDANVVFEGGNALAPLIVKTNSTASGYGMLVHSSVPSQINDTARIQSVGASSTSAILNCLNNANDVTGSATSVFYVRADGNVGVGTDSPSSTLHVVGDAQVDNININGNTITSTDAAGNINLAPDTTGDLVLDGLKWPQSDGSAGQTLITDGAAQLSWSDAGSVTVPTVDQTVARFNGTTGALEDSGVTINDSDVMSGITQLNVDNLRADGNTVESTSGALNLTGATDVSITSTSGDINLTAGSGNIVAADNFVAGDPGTEGSGIDINGTTYDSVFKASDIGGSNAALGIYHRHSTTLQPLLIGAHSNSDTTAHGTVTSGQSMFTVYGAGWTGSHYDLFGAIDISADTSGTIGATSSPGRIRFQVTPDASNTPVTALTISNNSNVTFANNAIFATAKGILDGNSNEQLLFTQTASAVNYLNITNAATGGNPVLEATGSDSVVGMDFIINGSGSYFSFNQASTTRVKIANDGQVYWGSLADAGRLSWDTAVAFVRAESGNSLRLGSNGSSTSRLEISAAGNVGISNNSPTYPLDVNGSAAAYMARFSDIVSAGTALAAFRNTAAFNTSAAIGFEFRLNSSTSERQAGLITANFTTTTDASRSSKMDFKTISSTAQVTPLSLVENECHVNGISWDGGTNVLSSFLDKNEYNPTITATGSGTITLYSTFNTLGYTRIGNTVTVTGRITVQSVSSPTGNLSISLPVTSANMSEEAGICAGSIIVTGTANNINTFTMQVPESSATFFVYGASGTAVSQIASTIVADTGITVNFTYQV